MPLLSSSNYVPVPYLFNAHLETVVPSIFRKIERVHYQRERLELPDGDFLDLDWLRAKHDRLVIISHGLEGSSDRHYCRGMARHFFENGWDALAWNCRGCSGEVNRLPRFYHHGATDDLKAVVQRAVQHAYQTIALVGFSMGGSLSLKFLGEGIEVPPQVKGAVVFSVPCDLGSSARELDQPGLLFYRNRFLKKLEKKVAAKAKLFPEVISHQGFHTIRTFREFDNRYTAPLHGFRNADDFYLRASCGNYLEAINLPALIANAENDPFLPDACYPRALARSHRYVHLEIPTRGGHVGFSLLNRKENWMEVRALEFLNSVV